MEEMSQECLSNAAGAISGQQIIQSLEQQREFALRYQRDQMLRLAFEFAREAKIAGDHQAIIRIARDFLTFLDEG